MLHEETVRLSLVVCLSTNPLHGVERRSLVSSPTSILSLGNPLHGVERKVELTKKWRARLSARIHYMELKVGVFPSLSLFNGIES